MSESHAHYWVGVDALPGDRFTEVVELLRCSCGAKAKRLVRYRTDEASRQVYEYEGPVFDVVEPKEQSP